MLPDSGVLADSLINVNLYRYTFGLGRGENCHRRQQNTKTNEARLMAFTTDWIHRGMPYGQHRPVQLLHQRAR